MQLGCKQLPMWDADIAGGGSLRYVTPPASLLLFVTPPLTPDLEQMDKYICPRKMKLLDFSNKCCYCLQPLEKSRVEMIISVLMT